MSCKGTSQFSKQLTCSSFKPRSSAIDFLSALVQKRLHWKISSNLFRCNFVFACGAKSTIVFPRRCGRGFFAVLDHRLVGWLFDWSVGRSVGWKHIGIF